MNSVTPEQRAVCQRFSVTPHPPAAASKVGIALQTRGLLPLNALRLTEVRETCGWYLWWGDADATDEEFYQPVHVEHLIDRCPEVLPYLALPPGWRVQLAPDHEDVWFDASILST